MRILLKRYKFLMMFFLVFSLNVLFVQHACYADIVEADGYYLIGDGPEENISIAKERAKLDALRNVIEKVGVYVESYTKTKNYTISNDEIRVVAGNIVKVDECNIEPIIEGNCIKFKCHIKAIVDSNNIDLKKILDNKILMEQSLEQEKKIETLTDEITKLKKSYIEANQENERLKIQKRINDNENELKVVLVQVTDYTAEKLYKTIKIHNGAKNVNLKINEMKEFKNMGDLYEPYVILIEGNNSDEKCILTLFTNKMGYVSKITISSSFNDIKSRICSYKTEYVVLGALGIEDSRAKSFMDDIRARDLPVKLAIWNNWTNRNIAVEHGWAPTTDNIFYIRISAYDKLFENERMI